MAIPLNNYVRWPPPLEKVRNSFVVTPLNRCANGFSYQGVAKFDIGSNLRHCGSL